MKKVMGLCNLYSPATLGDLTSSRPIASTTFLGRYAMMDFTLSNFSNSDIDQVGILIKKDPRSILKHLGSTNVWNNNTKLGFELIMYDEKNANNPLYHHDLNNIKVNDWIIKRERPAWFVIAPVHIIYALDFRPILAFHEAHQKPITVVYTKIKDGKSHFLNGDVLTLQQDRIVEMQTNQGLRSEIDVSMETYIISAPMLESMLTNAQELSPFFGIKETIQALLKTSTIMGYRFSGYVKCFDSLSSYRLNSLELLNYSVRKKLFNPELPIRTVTHDTAPAYYGSDANVANSFIANGSVIEGTVVNSIISRNVHIGKNARIENAIIFTDTVIGKDVMIKNVVIDKYAKVITSKQILGTDLLPIYIKQGEKT
jgi:glucose-1-phosphate adenylyltransferase